MSVAIAIEVGSPLSRLEQVETTISSIMRNIGVDDYKLIIAVSPLVDKQIKEYINTLHWGYETKVELMPERDYFWADFINEAIDRAKGCKYFIESHDDIELLTPNFIPKVEYELNISRERVGWVSFTDKEYLTGAWTPSTRHGFHRDYYEENAWDKQKMFQFRCLPDDWWRPPLFRYYVFIAERIIRYHLHMKPCAMPTYPREYYESLYYVPPNYPVKCHAPFNHFVLIEMDRLQKIGKCENWHTHNALLVDEDWGLRALQLNFHNIWIPSIEYIHHKPKGGTRSWKQIAVDAQRVDQLFFEKWGFHSDARLDELDFIAEKYKGTEIPWSIGKWSWEWDYLLFDIEKKGRADELCNNKKIAKPSVSASGREGEV